MQINKKNSSILSVQMWSKIPNPTTNIDISFGYKNMIKFWNPYKSWITYEVN